MTTAKTTTFRYPVSTRYGQQGTAMEYWEGKVVYLNGENNYTDNIRVDKKAEEK